MENSKLIVIVGPTASGKSNLAVRLAKEFNGEVISADSGQVYRGMDIGTGKITGKEMRGIPHHLLDVVSPKIRFTVAQYRRLALETIGKILGKGKIPILCGGTGFYIQTVIDGITIPEVKPDWKLRAGLGQLTTDELFKKLKKLDPRRAKTIDRFNPRRLIRAIEIVIKTKKPVPRLRQGFGLRLNEVGGQAYPVLMIGLKLPKNELRKRIEQRVEKMLKLGLEKEAKKFSLPIIGYQEWSSPNPKDLIIRHTIQYAKRQITWFKRDKRIFWIKNYKEAQKLTKQFL
ncbi:MAG: tRNA (adenosine(37)-N6)-dimethylallyltransferase MiaA [Candidatus Wildermuthbacteria bacterium]|nr:tRNA (adenosine(37)-N6)-dimethylallyltransferase MiaA [Candidatus Wildermuthbacteria bacterium]